MATHTTVHCPALQGIHSLQEVVPTCLAAACPSLQTLRIQCCHFQHPPPAATTAGARTHARLRTLVVESCHPLPLQLLAAALAALPELASFVLSDDGTTSQSDVCTALTTGAGQLTQLRLASERFPDQQIVQQLCTPSLDHGAPFRVSRLQRLDISYAVLVDAGLRALLAHLPALTHVWVNACELRSSHAAVDCSWDELRVDEGLTCTSLAHLPLQGIKHLRTECLMMDEADIPDAAAAMAAAPDCAFACDGDVTLHCRASELPQLLPLLARWRGVAGLELITPDSTDSCLIPVAVGALGVLLQGMPLCTQLRLDGFTPHQFAPLLPALAGTAVDTIFLEVCRPGRSLHPGGCDGRQL